MTQVPLTRREGENTRWILLASLSHPECSPKGYVTVQRTSNWVMVPE